MAAAPVPAVAVVLPGATPGTGRTRDKLAVDRRRGHAPVRIVRHGEFGGAAEVPQNPAAKLRKSQSPRRVDASRYPLPGGSLPHRKKRFAEPGIDDRRIKKSTQFKHEKMRKFSVINVSSL
jgi:hypothetical protein